VHLTRVAEVIDAKLRQILEQAGAAA
jgi:hypothetical protein